MPHSLITRAFRYATRKASAFSLYVREFRPLGQLQTLTGSSPRAVAEVIQRNNLAVVRGIQTERARREGWEFAHSVLVVPKMDGENLVKLTSRGNETDLSLVRSILNPRLVAILRAYFEAVAKTRDFFLPYHGLLARHFDPARVNPHAVVPYHQDAFAHPAGVRMLNCWTLLYPEECGATSPGLDFIPIAFRRFVEIERNPTTQAYSFLESDHKQLAQMERRRPAITPSLRLGDMIIFNELAMHRTSRRLGMTKGRVSAEVRAVAATPEALAWLSGHAAAHVCGGRIEWASRWAEGGGGLVPLELESAPLD